MNIFSFKSSNLTDSITEFQLNVLSKAAWIVIHYSLSITKGFKKRIYLEKSERFCFDITAMCAIKTLARY